MPRRRMRMGELERLSGVPRETIHYYLREGLLPEPVRRGRTQAFYDETHLERLALVRRLREEKYFPVAVIRSVLAAGLEGPRGRDVETLADVLRIDPHLTGDRAPPVAVDEGVEALARDLGLLRTGEGRDDPAVARVLSSVAEAVELQGDARELTLRDLEVSAPRVRDLVEAEAAVFFDTVIRTGDLGAAVGALRAGRSAVARFLAAYRDLMLRRIVESLASAVGEAAGRVKLAAPLPLSPALRARLGVDARRSELLALAHRGDVAKANELVWHLFVLGPSRDLGKLGSGVAALLRPRGSVLVAAAAEDAAELERILDRAGAFPLGSVLAASHALRGALAPLRDEHGVLERAVPALRRLFDAAPGRDADPLASALAYLYRGLVALALPQALGRVELATGDLDAALRVVLSAPGRLHPALHATLEANARLGLGRGLSLLGLHGDARAELRRAGELDPTGPVAKSAETLLATFDPEILAGVGRTR
jgi:tetratricopeptide (TPR) repeat protein